MKFRYHIIFISLVVCACGEREEVKPPPSADISLVEQFLLTLEDKKEISFRDSSNRGAGADGTIISLHFLEESKLHAHTYGNGFSSYHGTYTVLGINRVEIHLEHQDWPDLVLSQEKGLFLLSRLDGSESLTNHIVIKKHDGTEYRINDADIYPEAESRIFPFTQNPIKEVEQDASSDAIPLLGRKP